MNRLMILGFLTALSAFLPTFASRAFADCGQIIVVARTRVVAQTYVPPASPIVAQPGPTALAQSQATTQPLDPAAVAQAQATATTIAVPTTYPADNAEWTSSPSAKGPRTFREPEQKGVIAWNGKEQILALTTLQSAFTDRGAALSVMPLPGKPISVKAARAELFTDAHQLVIKKILAGGAKRVLIEEKIGAHNIFVIEADNPAAFFTEVKDFVTKKFGPEARPLLSESTQRIIRDYMDQGFRYFAFDLVMTDVHLAYKQMIEYRFETNALYYPLVISASGGTGATNIQLVVFTHEPLSSFRRGALPESRIDSTSVVTISDEELRNLAPEMAELMQSGPVQGRIWTITGQLDEFTGDLWARR